MYQQIIESADFLKKQITHQPEIGIILGTGLGSLVNEVLVQTQISYESIPHFPVSTVESHKGKLLFGTIHNKQVVVMQGRFHYYEGYSLQQVTFPVRVLKMLGIKKLFISNAAGGLNPQQEVGSLMMITDHINLLPDHPLRGKNIDELGPRFPDMSDAYCSELAQLARTCANKLNIKLHEGVYAAVQGPTLETKAEYKYLRIIGADAVGMSTVPENIVARHMGIPVFAISVITDMGIAERMTHKISLQDVIDAANSAQPKLTALVSCMIGKL
ncbi:MAG: purine-nucleoside phosphorylase [Bacteroidia bacterium]